MTHQKTEAQNLYRQQMTCLRTPWPSGRRLLLGDWYQALSCTVTRCWTFLDFADLMAEDAQRQFCSDISSIGLMIRSRSSVMQQGWLTTRQLPEPVLSSRCDAHIWM